MLAYCFLNALVGAVAMHSAKVVAMQCGGASLSLAAFAIIR